MQNQSEINVFVMLVTMKILVFWDVMPCAMTQYPENGNSRVTENTGTLCHITLCCVS